MTYFEICHGPIFAFGVHNCRFGLRRADSKLSFFSRPVPCAQQGEKGPNQRCEAGGETDIARREMQRRRRDQRHGAGLEPRLDLIDGPVG